MKVTKKAIALTLAAFMVIVPIAVKADYDRKISEMTPISEPIEVQVPEYIELKGIIEEVRDETDQFSILVKNDGKNGLDALVAYIDKDVILLSDKTMDFASKDTLKIGMEVSIYYHHETMMAMIYPPTLGPDVVVINESEVYVSVMVSKFDKDLLNAEKDLYIQPSNKTIIVDIDGNKVEKEMLVDRDLIVFYDAIMKSYPAQTTPIKIIMMPEREDQIIDEVNIKEFTEFKGKIEEIRNENGQFSILAKNDLKEGLDALVAFVNEDVILLNDKDMKIADKNTLKVGQEVSIYYHKDTMMLMSYPPMLGPDVVVINESKVYVSVMVSKFDKDLLNAEKDLYIQPSNETIIVDKDGNKVEKEMLVDRDLIVFYDIQLESYPAQTTPIKIIMMPEREEQVIIETPIKVEIILKNELIKTKDGVTMIPLRLVGETLGYEVSWNQVTKTADLLRGLERVTVTIGDYRYNDGRLVIDLGTAASLIDSRTFVPLSFAEKVLEAKVEVLEDGSVRIIK